MTAVLKASSDQTTRVRRLAFKPPPKKEGLNKLSHDIMRTAEELSPGNENFASLQTDSVSQTPVETPLIDVGSTREAKTKG